MILLSHCKGKIHTSERQSLNKIHVTQKKYRANLNRNYFISHFLLIDVDEFNLLRHEPSALFTWRQHLFNEAKFVSNVENDAFIIQKKWTEAIM